MKEPSRTFAVIGAGPAGLMAADMLSRAGHHVTVYERMPSPARKFLMAGRGGLNLTHSEPLERFLTRYGAESEWLAPIIAGFTPEDARDWSEALGEPPFIGSSGRVFPRSFKASPLLRAWLRQLDAQGVRLATRHQWLGWEQDGALLLRDPHGETLRLTPDACVLALGGASWPRLGADGGWVAPLMGEGMGVTPLAPANCGIRINWSALLRDKFAGTPLKRIALAVAQPGAEQTQVRGEAMITEHGLEGGAVYALSRVIRERLNQTGAALLHLDLKPELSLSDLAARLSRPRQGQSTATWLRKTAGLQPVEIALLREGTTAQTGANATTETAPRALPIDDAAALAGLIKAVPLTVSGVAGLERAISTAGGLRLNELDDRLMLKRHPGCFVAGEMLDWEAPTGGYLLQATLATGKAAAEGALAWLEQL